jgi:hypothetical protein
MLQAEVTNNCTCIVYDEETGDNLKDEYGYDARPDYCYGDCFDESVRDLNDNVLPEWLNLHRATSDDYVLIGGSGMGWLRQSGKIIARATGEHIVKAMSINGDFTLRFKLEDKSFTAVRSSHDELGALFAFEVMAEDALEQARDWGYTIVE